MAHILQRVLELEDVARVRHELETLTWTDGRRTAGQTARATKQNQQLDSDDQRVQALERFVADALQRHPMFEPVARPARLSRLMFSRYEPAMSYGDHTDDALIGGAPRLRTDLAFTIFLNEPATYDGGALALNSALGEQEIKLEAGDAILYPAGPIHRVTQVTKGVRLAAVGWVQSFVADPARREILFDLSVTRARLAQAGVAQDQLLPLDKSISNLLRMWAQG